MILLAAIPLCLSGQITSPQSDAMKELTYPVHTGTDPLYVFYQENGNFIPGSLRAEGPTAGNFDFVWTKYDPDADGFTIPVSSEINVLTSNISNLDEGGYQVQVTNGVDVDTSFIAWLMLDNLRAITAKDAEGKLESFRSGCSDGNFIIIAGSVEIDTFYYYDPTSHEQIRFQNDYDILWTSDNPDLTVYNPTDKTKMGANFSDEPPYKDTYYILTATDSLGMTDVDSVLYDTKHTKAEFTVEYWDKINLEWDEGLNTEWSKDKGSLDAPLTVRYSNTSLNGYEFKWVFLDTTNEVSGLSTFESELTLDSTYKPQFTYETAGKFYYPYLISESDAGCIDTFALEDGIEVVPAELLIPNVFTPNDDGNNDVFLFKHQSLKECRVTIADRFGNVVYRQKIDNIYEWEGWRGTILNSDRRAPEGQYYYVIEGLGYDNVEFKDPNYLEQRKLNRQGGTGTGGNTGQNTDDPDAQSLNLYTGWLYLFRGIGEF